jgi:DUF1365 family protein
VTASVLTRAVPATALATTPALYDGVVAHARTAPIRNTFRYRASYWLVDIDAPPPLPRGLRWLAKFRDTDHLDVRALLAAHGKQADRILMLATARTLGYVFNPITVFWCYDASGARVATVAEVHNTYGQRHAYVLDADDDGRACVDKQLYVSPFYPVDGHYELRLPEPGAEVSLTVTLHRPDDQPFVATLQAARREPTLANVARSWVRCPWAPLRVTALIRWQGVRLWRRGLKVQPR